MNSLYLSAVCVLCSSLLAFLSFHYFRSLSIDRRRRTRKQIPTVPLAFASLLIGLISTGLVRHFDFGGMALVVAFLVSVVYFLFDRSSLIFSVNAFASALLNYSGLYLMVSSSFTLVDWLPWGYGSPESRSLILSCTSILGSLLMGGLSRGRRLPNRKLGMVLRKKNTSGLLGSYMFFFSAINVFSLFWFVPQIPLYRESPAGLLPLVVDLNLKTLLSMAGSYLLVYYLCRWVASEQEGKDLNADLKREQNFRRSVFTDEMIRFCINLSRDTFEEGGSQFVHHQSDGSIETLHEYIRLCIHPGDQELIAPYADATTVHYQFVSTSTRVERLRLSPKALLETIRLEESIRSQLAALHDPWIWVEHRFIKTVDSDSHEEYLYVIVRNINEEATAEAALKDAADRDPMTGLYNRGAFRRIVEEHLASPESQGTLYLIDMDHFKMVNDNLGHPAGDELIGEIAQILLSEFRSEDVVARMGGDEFAVYSPGLRSQQVLVRRAASLKGKAVHSFTDRRGVPFRTTVSIGIARAPLDGAELDVLYDHADRALYHAKEAGRNRFVLYTSQMDPPS